MKRLFYTLILFAHTVCFVFSYDFGVLSYQQAEAGHSGFSYNPVFVPWYSYNSEDGLQIYASMRLSFDINNFDNEMNEISPVFVPEILRFSASYPYNNILLEAGRIAYSDILGFTAAGLFDGLRLETVLGKGIFKANALYTGLLYKETAMIVMNSADISSYIEPWDFGSFGNYFASKRFLISLNYNMPVFDYHLLMLESLFQFDLNGTDEKLHSQYSEVMLELFPLGKAGFIFGTVFQLTDDFNMAAGAIARFRMDAPGPLNDGFNIIVKFGSGIWSDSFCAFLPVSSPAQGVIFPGSISGLVVFSADYMVRLNRTMYADAAFLYFTRSYNDAYGNFYGGELQASFAWQPFEDLRLQIAGAAFFPGLGNAYPDDTGAMWKIVTGFAISF